MKKLIFYGDSIIEGSYGVSFLNIVKEELIQHHFEIINKGEIGDTSQNLIDRLERDVISLNPDYVFLHIAVNDLMSYISDKPYEKMDKWTEPITPITFRENINYIVERLLSKKVKIVIILPGSIEGEFNIKKNNSLEEYVKVLEDIVLEYNLFLIDFRSEFNLLISNNKKRSTYDFILSNIVKDMKEILLKYPTFRVERNVQLKNEYHYFLSQLSYKRGMQLTFDGAHFTFEGAKLMSQQILNFVNKNI